MPDLIALGIALFLSWLFGSAAVHKARNLEHYRQLMARYLNGRPVSASSVWLIAAVEMSSAAMLLLPQTRPTGLLVAALLLLAYAALMGLQLARGRADMKCGCAGPASDMTISPALIVRNLVCAALALVASMPVISVEAGLAGIGLGLFVAVFTTLIYLGSEQLIANAQQMAGEG